MKCCHVITVNDSDWLPESHFLHKCQTCAKRNARLFVLFFGLKSVSLKHVSKKKEMHLYSNVSNYCTTRKTPLL